MTLAEPTTYADTAVQYARDVTAGETAACQWVRLAAQRFIDDLDRAETDWPYRFDADAAERACRFIELLPHVKGDWAKRHELIRLEPWQVFIIANIFGWLQKADGLRRFRSFYGEVPRKNAKSTITSGVALFMVAEDGEIGAECYAAATTRNQAGIVFKDAREMVRNSPDLRSAYGADTGVGSVHVLETNSFFRSVTAEGATNEGLNVHFAAVDELHAHKTPEVYNVLNQGMGSRSQPLIWVITTAGLDRSGICYSRRKHLTDVLLRVIEDETYFGIIYTIDDGDDWTDPKVWAKANPNLGVSVYDHDIERLCAEAQSIPSDKAVFLTKRLNVWVSSYSPWMDMQAWDRCGDPTLDEQDFITDPCWGGVDLATLKDMSEVARGYVREIANADGVMEEHLYVFTTHYLPEDRAAPSENTTYWGWGQEGHLKLTPGNVTDLDAIEADISALPSTFDVRGIGFDPHQARQMVNHLVAEGLPMVEYRPTVLNFSQPMKELEAFVLSGRFHHNGDPVLAWMASNVVAHLDAKDNIYPRKERDEDKIDGIVAIIMLIGCMRLEPVPTVSRYETEGIRTIGG